MEDDGLHPDAQDEINRAHEYLIGRMRKLEPSVSSSWRAFTLGALTAAVFEIAKDLRKVAKT